MMIGREYELKLLKKMNVSEKAELGIVYGRRRIGKSYLLKKIISRQRKDFYFEAIRHLSYKNQIDHFTKQLAEQTKTVQVKAHTWQEAFDTLTLYISRGKHYVVFDELPWMASERKELISILKYYWDNKWKNNSGLKLILCGSIVQYMVNHVIHSESLHNRKTFELKLGPLSPQEAQKFLHNKRSYQEITKTLMVFGGIPKYLEQINSADSLSVNLDRLCFQKAGFFLTEFETIFKEQFKVIKKYNLIIKALSRKNSTKDEIAKSIKTTSGGGLTTYLDNLERAEFIQKMTSIDLGSGRAEKSKTHKFKISDEWLRFYFTYMESQMRIIEKNIMAGQFNRSTKNSILTYWGLAFELFCEKNINCIYETLSISPEDIEVIGPYFQQAARIQTKNKSKRGAQFDLVIKRNGGILTFIECKFTENPVGLQVAHEVNEKIRRLALPRKYSIEKVLISAAGVTPELQNSRVFNKILGLEIFY